MQLALRSFCVLVLSKAEGLEEEVMRFLTAMRFLWETRLNPAISDVGGFETVYTAFPRAGRTEF